MLPGASKSNRLGPLVTRVGQCHEAMRQLTATQKYQTAECCGICIAQRAYGNRKFDVKHLHAHTGSGDGL